MHSKIDKGPKNTDHVIMLFQSILKEFSFYIIVGYCFWKLFLYIIRFLNIFSIHVPIKKLEFKCDGSLHSIFCRFLQTFVYHKIWTLRRFFYKVNLFIWIVLRINIFSSIYTFIPIKNIHTQSKAVWNIYKIL